MARNRHKKKHAITTSPVPKPAVEIPSPAVQAITDRITSGGPQYLTDYGIQAMIDSATFINEPEFLDCSLDGKRAAEITERWLEKYEKRLAAAEKKSEDEYQQVFDEVRIKAIDELITPDFRRDVNDRLEMLLTRVTAARDTKKAESIILLKILLSRKELPWGICGLILEFYNRAIEKTILAFQQEEEIVNKVLAAANDEGDKTIDMETLLRSPEKLEKVSEKLLEEDPGLLEITEKRAYELIDQFEHELLQGKIDLKLFTMEEQLLPFHRLEEEFGLPPAGMETSEQNQKRILDVINQAIKDIMTPARIQRMRKDIETTSKTWMRQRNKWAVMLENQLAWLDEESIEDYGFLFSAFWGQLKAENNARKTGQKSKKRKR